MQKESKCLYLRDYDVTSSETIESSMIYRISYRTYKEKREKLLLGPLWVTNYGETSKILYISAIWLLRICVSLKPIS